jgi:hypothetical protein
MAILISMSGTRSGIGAMSLGGVPNTVARSAAESARPVAGPDAGGGAMICGAEGAAVTGESSAAPRANAAASSNAANAERTTFICIRLSRPEEPSPECIKTVLPQQSSVSEAALDIETTGPHRTSEFRTLSPARSFVR